MKKKFEATESDSNVERVDTSNESANSSTQQKEVQQEGKAQEKNYLIRIK